MLFFYVIILFLSFSFVKIYIRIVNENKIRLQLHCINKNDR